MCKIGKWESEWSVLIEIELILLESRKLEASKLAIFFSIPSEKACHNFHRSNEIFISFSQFWIAYFSELLIRNVINVMKPVNFKLRR